MATRTTGNLGLTKPESSDKPNQFRSGYNENMDKIDKAFTGIVQESAFEIVLEGTEYVLYWYGAEDECPYSIECEGANFVLYFNYEEG